MKKLMFLIPVIGIALAVHGQDGGDKSKRASPPAKASETTNDGVMITIDYSQPSVKGRSIGKDLEPLPGKVWRTGANEATVFEVNKDVKVDGKPLPAGKYGLFTIANGDDWTIIFNKTWKQWGAFTYKDADDVLRVNAKGKKAPSFNEKFTINVAKDGKVSLLWGDKMVDFWIK
ncbi:MAG TPA: DUF2911 domain-containing protein [Puia sp.]|nr:DUF2911 domain-containing protein [Puia sp.]